MGSRYSGDVLAVVEQAIEAARRTLADMEGDDVPPRLRKVVLSSARSLPPPLARLVVTHLDEDDAFRTRVAEEAAGLSSEAALAFLTRGPGWWALVAEALAARQVAVVEGQVAEAERRLARAERFAGEAKVRAEEARRDAEEATAAADDKVEAARRRLRDLAAGDASATRAVDARVTELEEIAAERAARAESLRVVVEALQRRVRAMRRERPTERSGERGSLPSDPVARARTLDLQFAVAARDAGGEVPVAASPSGEAEFGLPLGVRPDSAEALTWLLSAPGSTVIVDGYNVLFRVVAEEEAVSGAARTRLETALRLLHRQSDNRHAVVVVYDSTLAGDRSPRPAGKGLEVRFAPADRLADEEIADLAAARAGRVVVVSSDRQVREDAAAAGAITLWSEALLPLLVGG